MFADSLSVLFIHFIARGLGANFLYKCCASCGGSLRQHGLLVAQLTAECPYTLQSAAPLPLKIAPFHARIWTPI